MLFGVGQIVLLTNFLLFTFIRNSAGLFEAFGFGGLGQPAFISLVLFQFIRWVTAVCGGVSHTESARVRIYMMAHTHTHTCFCHARLPRHVLQSLNRLADPHVPPSIPHFPGTCSTRHMLLPMHHACFPARQTGKSRVAFSHLPSKCTACCSHIALSTRFPKCTCCISSPIDEVVHYAQNVVSRTFEFQADGFAVSQVRRGGGSKPQAIDVRIQ